jgi:hypothetical protein
VRIKIFFASFTKNLKLFNYKNIYILLRLEGLPKEAQADQEDLVEGEATTLEPPSMPITTICTQATNILPISVDRGTGLWAPVRAIIPIGGRQVVATGENLTIGGLRTSFISN